MTSSQNRQEKSSESTTSLETIIALGLFGDAKFFDGIGELRVDYGPGYRVYFVKRGNEVVILLCGGDKSRQTKDIKQAIEMAKEV